MQRTLHGYWRSSASYRVRIALNLKQLDYRYQAVSLIKGEQKSDAYLAQNPQGLLPLYVEEEDGQTFKLAQSLAIMDYLDEVYPKQPLLPVDAKQRAKIKAAAQIIACEVHPLDNLRVLKYLESEIEGGAAHKLTWYRHWVTIGFTAFEKELSSLLKGKMFSLGNQPGYLEAVLIPQVYNAYRFDCPMQDYPHIAALNDACMQLADFQHASPDAQPDAF